MVRTIQQIYATSGNKLVTYTTNKPTDVQKTATVLSTRNLVDIWTQIKLWYEVKDSSYLHE